MQNYEKARSSTLVKHIYSLFKGKRKILAATALSQIKGSNVTIQKAKFMLGIKSKRIAGKFYWMAPQCTPEVALRIKEKFVWAICNNPQCPLYKSPVEIYASKPQCMICKNKKMEIIRYRPHQQEGFKRMMRWGGYYVPQSRALPTMMSTLHASRTEVFALKKELGVTTFREKDGKYYWVQLAPVVEWLSTRVKSQPIAATTLQEEAHKARIPWHMVVTARRVLHNISIKHTESGEYWQDLVDT